MEVKLTRYNSAKDHTNGMLHIDGVFQCYTLEDEHRDEKKHSETRIPDGTYELQLRDFGGFDARYRKVFGNEWHKGMIWLRDVPNFEYILIHIGNTDEDTAGCILVGTSNNAGENFIGNSKTAYKQIYPLIRDAIIAHRNSYMRVFLTIETIG